MKKKQKPTDQYERDAKGNILGERPDVRLVPGHHTGPQSEYGGAGYGYTLYADGSYELAPGQQSTFVEIGAEIDAIQVLVNGVLDYARKHMATLQKRRFAWFSDVSRTLYREGDTDQMTYNPHTGKVIFKPLNPAKDEKALAERIELDKAGAGTGKEP